MRAADETPPELESAFLALNALSVAATTHHLYPNPSEQPAFRRALTILSELAESGKRLAVRVARDHFRVGDTPVGTASGSIQRLAGALFERGVTEVRLRSVPTADELVAFCAMTEEDPTAVEAAGGPRSWLSERSVLALGVTARDLRIGTVRLRDLTSVELPDDLRALLADQQHLARALEKGASPEAAVARLKELFDRGVELGIDETDLYAGIADTLGAMSFAFRTSVLGLAMGSLPEDLSLGVSGQLSDGELTDVLAALAADRGLDVAMTYAFQVAVSSGGRRDELPVTLGKSLLEMGLDREQVLRAFGTARLIGEGKITGQLPTDVFTPRAVEEVFELDALRAETPLISPADEFEIALAMLQVLLRANESPDQVEDLADQAERMAGRWLLEAPERSAAVVEVLAVEAEAGARTERGMRLDAALRRVASPELAQALLDLAAGEQGELATRILDLLGPRSIPALTERLAGEADQGRRKILVEWLAQAAREDPAPLLPALDNSPWYLARNIASVLARLNGPDVVPHLGRLASHEDPRVRREALRGMSTLGSGALPALRRALDDSDRTARMTAIAVLGALQEPEAAEALVGIVGERFRSMRERREALDSLRLHESDRAHRFLERTASRRWPPTRATRELARHARTLLARMGGLEETNPAGGGPQ